MKLDVFISGENVDLCVPTREFAEKSQWYNWFNDLELTQNMERGVFPNTPQKQVEFFDNIGDQRLVLIVANKKSEYIGVVSLSRIDHIMKLAELAMILTRRKGDVPSPILALEAVALITEHGFNVLGLNRIEGSQVMRLAGWQQRLEILGYKLEGILREQFTKGQQRHDLTFIGVNYSDYKTIVAQRGKYWDSGSKMFERIKNLPKTKLQDQLKAFFDTEGTDYYNKIFNL